MPTRLLLADDDQLLRKVLSSSLTRAGYEVVAVGDGAPAIALADGPPFDIVVADLHMEEVDGLEVVRHYKAKFGASVCCVVLSGEDDEAVSTACYEAGADDVICKPTSPAALRQRLSAATLSLRAHARGA